MKQEALRVLLVEDEGSLREPLAKRLREDHTYQIDAVADAAGAWHLVTQASRPYDVALIDDLLTPEPDAEPEPIGIELMERIRKRCPETECIVFTGWGMDRALAALRAGAYRYLAKPLNTVELGMTIHMAAEQSRLRRERDLLSATLEISNSMISGLDVAQTFRTIAEAVLNLIGAEACAVTLEDASTGQVRYELIISTGDVAVQLQPMEDHSLTRQILESGQATISSAIDALEDSGRVDENLSRAGVKSCIGVPIPGEPQNRRVLYAYSTRPGAFSTYEQQVLELLASQAAIALENARLFEAEAQRRREAETLRETALALTTTLEQQKVIDRILIELQKVVPYDSASVQLLNGERLEIIGGRGFPNTSDIVGFSFSVAADNPNREVIRRRDGLIVPDAVAEYEDFLKEPHIQAGIRGWLGVPMLFGDQLVGMIALDKRQPGFYTEEHTRLAKAFATQAALAIQNTRLFDEVNRRAQDLETLQNLTLTMNSSLDVDETLKSACQSAVDFFNADHSGLVLFNLDQSQGKVTAEYPNLGTLGTIIPLRGVTAEETLAETGHPLVIHNVTAEDSLGPVRDILLGFDIQSIVIVPVVSKNGQPLGSFSVDAVGHQRLFTREEVELCQVFAAHVAVAVENARLFSELSEAKEWGEALIENVFDAVIAIDQNRKINVFNHRAEEMFGWRAGEMTGQTVARLHTSVEKARDIFELVNCGEAISGWRVDLRHRDGNHIPALLSATQIRDSEGHPIGQAGFIRDLRQMNLLEERLRALIEVSQALTGLLDKDEVLNQVVLSALVAFPTAQHGAIHLYDEPSDALVLQAHTIKLDKGATIDSRLKPGEGIAGWVFQHQQPTVVDDTQQDPRYKKIGQPDVPVHRSMMCVPLKVKDRVIGTLSLDNRDVTGAFRADDMGLLATFADQAAIALENANLYAASKHHAEEMELLYDLGMSLNASLRLEEVLDQVARSCQRLINAGASTALAYDKRKDKYIQVGVPDQPRMPAIVDEPRPDGYTKLIMDSGEPVIIPDVTQAERVKAFVRELGVRSMAGVPIQLFGEAIGVLYVHSAEPHGFADHEVDLLSFLANQAAIAIANAQYFEDAQTGLKQHRSLYEASSAIISNMDPARVLEVVAEEARRALGGWRVKIALLTGESWLTDLVAVGFEDGLDTGDLIRQDGISAEVLVSGEPWYLEDVQEAPDDVNPAMLVDGVRAAACVPFSIRGHNIGVMWLHYKETRRFLPTEIEALRLYANHAAIAFDNARKMQELKHLRQAAEMLASVVGVKKVLQQIVMSAREVLGADSSVIWSYNEVRHTFLPDELVAEGVEAELLERFREDEPRRGGTAEMVMQRGYLAVTDVQDQEYTFLGPTARGLRGELGAQAFQGIALKVGKERLGVLYLNYNRARGFNEDEEATLRMFASHAALALKNARLLEQVRKARDAAKIVAEVSLLENLEQTLDSIVNGTQDVLGCDAVSLYTYDLATDELGYPPVLTGVWDPPKAKRLPKVPRESIVFRMLKRDEPYIVDNTSADPLFNNLRFVVDEQIKSCIAMPLKVGEHKVGVMFVNYRSRHRFTGEELTNIELFAYQAAVAIRNARLLADISHRSTQLQTVTEVSKSTSTILDPERLMDQAVNLIREGFDLYYVGLFLVDEAGDHAVLRAGTGEAGRKMLDEGYKLAIGDQSMVGWSVANAQAHTAPDVGKEVMHLDNPYLPETRSEIALPLTSRGKCIGALTVQSAEEAAFSPEDTAVLQTMADQLAIAIENARLYQTEQRRVKELSGLNSISQSIRSLTDIQEVCQQVNASMAQLIGTQMCAILLYDETERALVSQLPIYGVPDAIGRQYRIDLGKGKPATLWETADYLILNNVEQHPLVQELRFTELAQSAGVCDTLLAKLTAGKKNLGIVQASNKIDGTPFNEDDARLLCIFVGQAAAVIENARLYKELKQAYVDLRQTRGLVGARTALAWMGMTSSAWRHTIERQALTIREQAQLLRQDCRRELTHPKNAKVRDRIAIIERLATQIMEKPITPPLSTEAGLRSVSPSALVGERTRQLQQDAPYRRTTLRLDLRLPDSVTVWASPEWLRRAFDLLVDNAVQAVAQREVQEIIIGTREADEGIEISITDTGPGIPEEIQSKIGIHLIETPEDAKGLGMGLLMAQTIVQTYGGEIRVESTGPAGTTMVIWLPREK